MTVAQARKLVDSFNAEVKPGSLVEVCVDAKTKGPAQLFGKQPVVELEDLSGVWPLHKIRLPKKAA